MRVVCVVVCRDVVVYVGVWDCVFVGRGNVVCLCAALLCLC